MKKETAIKGSKGEIVLYRMQGGRTELGVRLVADTLWLNQKQIAELFETERSVITKHVRNIYKSGELVENSVCAKFAHTADDNQVEVLSGLVEGEMIITSGQINLDNNSVISVVKHK